MVDSITVSILFQIWIPVFLQNLAVGCRRVVAQASVFVRLSVYPHRQNIGEIFFDRGDENLATYVSEEMSFQSAMQMNAGDG